MSDAALLQAFVGELVAAGVRDGVVCPGSRSTPLALALRAASGLRVRVLYDERAAGFFALGMARTAGRPVVLLATSGTATVEFAPAVVEASLSRVPLVVLTADRPAELRDRGAPQTIDQVHLYGRAAKWFTELPLFDGEPATAAHVRSVAGRAVATAVAGPAGPVQVNVPFREPLLPDAPLATASIAGSTAARFTAAIAGRRTLDEAELERLAGRLADVRRGLILAGPDDDPRLPPALAALAAATGFPILADPLSGLRTGPHVGGMVIARGDQLARPGPWIDAHRPDLVLRTGAMPTSKPLLQLLEQTRPELLVFDGDGGWREAAILPSTFVHADAASTAVALAGRLAGRDGDSAWAAGWRIADDAASEAMTAWLAALAEPFEGAPFPALAAALPDGAVLWAGNSMPVRDLDAWLPSTERAITVRSNRGANGIDGVVSTALGSAAVADGPVALVVGDLSFLHDLNALVAARLHGLSATIVLLNNDGGGIFSFLPQATADLPGTGLPEHYEELFGTPHGIDVGPIVSALGSEHRRVGHRELAGAIAESIGRPGVQVLELRTDRARNVALHSEVARVVAAALERETGAR
ncbi:MAG: 2-succinyl-5-enolpyruvyl-6-hydroxy-3-cyclohexene-1-carboxylic-acid synthase [Chloroflexi bacterium RBG_16_72_14]|nr:MAG: 2-succinyl-5-enolpyruvyl-6-hydroxy-3-cyclohexene-1-carboxylic-acid synthase [Chloroflexi bacterium RBG_16_72_14]